MPFGAVTLRPGVDVEKTFSLNEAGVSVAQLIRYRDGLIETYGGWQNYVTFVVPSTARDLHAWQGITSDKHLAVGATANLAVITSGSNSDITPQTNTTNPAPNLSISSGSLVVTIVDGGSSASVFNTVYFNTPIAIGNLLLNGAYPINTVTASSVYTILSSVSASTTIASSGILPKFTTSSGSATVTVTLPNHGYSVIAGLFQQFIAASSVGGITIQGAYQVSSVVDSTSFKIVAATQATSGSTVTMNGGNAQFKYYITIGPQAAGGGFGGGGFGLGGFGTGVAQSGAAGTPITTTDWTLDNWGEVLLACPVDGPIYAWSPDSGFANAQVVNQAPFFNGGIFVSMPQQILVAWRSVQSTGVQDPLIVRWCNAGDYTNWTVSNQTTAGSFHIPTGSRIIGGMQGPGYGIISTDIDVWVMRYTGDVVVFNFSRVGAGCGWVGAHAAGILGGVVYWMGLNNFFVLGSSGVMPLPCSVWDFVFQNLNAANASKARCAVNSEFNEIAWFFPSLNASENDSYVKLRVIGQEFAWDYGTLSRTAWVDVSVLGAPIGIDTSGQLLQHETGNSITGAGLPSFQSGWWAIAEGEDIAFVDFVIPDFVWGTFAGAKTASVALTFFSVNYPGDTPYSYGPYIVTQATSYLNVRIRGRLMSVMVQSQGNPAFWRLGKIRFRYAVAGRR